MRVLVTGARGFVGARLVARLASEGDEVVGVDRETDVRDGGALSGAVSAARPEAVAHLAAISFVPESQAEPAESFRVNFLGTRNLLEAVLREAPGARVLVVGSGAVYGSAAPGAPAFDEQAPLRPRSPYAWTKAAADRLAAHYAGLGLAVVRVRPFNHTGPGRPDHFVESSFARQLAARERGLEDGPLRVGNLDAVRDFLDVADVVDAYLRLLRGEAASGVYNVASGHGRAVGDVLAALVALSTAKPETEIDPARWRPTDVSIGDATALRAATGWAPQVPLEQSLAALLDDWRARLEAT